MIKVICEYCNKPFKNYPSNKRKFCSSQCYNAFKIENNTRSIFKCQICKKAVKDAPSSTRKFCSVKCRIISQTGKNTKVNQKCEACNKDFKAYASEKRRFCDFNCSSGHNQLNIKGQKFGMLTVIKRVGSKNGISKWLCRCSCGTEKQFWLTSLKNKHNPTESCGCESKKLLDIIGEKYGRLTAIKRTKIENNPTYWLFRCVCGKEKRIRLSTVRHKNNPVKSCGCLSVESGKKNIKFAQLVPKPKGKDSPNWKGGKKARRLVHKHKRRALEQKADGNFTLHKWRQKIKFYGNHCYLCGIDLKDKETHLEHRIPLSRGGTNWIANIAPACADCNLSKHTKTESEFREIMNL